MIVENAQGKLDGCHAPRLANVPNEARRLAWYALPDKGTGL